jgi:hypothetical protein
MPESRQHPAPLALATRHVGEIDVDLVYAPVFHERRDVGDDGFEALGVMAVLREVHGKQDGIRTQFGRLHHPHR